MQKKKRDLCEYEAAKVDVTSRESERPQVGPSLQVSVLRGKC